MSSDGRMVADTPEHNEAYRGTVAIVAQNQQAPCAATAHGFLAREFAKKAANPCST